MTSTVDNSSLEIANKLLQQGKIQEAVAEYRRGIELTPDLSWHHYYLGEALTQLEDWEGAVSAYRQAISLGSNYLCYYRLGVALVKLERWDEAIEVLNQGLELKPDYYKFYLPLGQALVHQQHWEPAMEAYRKAVALKPGVAEFNLQLGYLLRRHRRFQEAAGYLQRAVDFQGDDPQLQLALGVALVEGGTDLDRAEGCLRRTLELQPDQGEAYFYLGKLCQRRDQLQEALGFYRRCGELSPGVDSALAVAAVLEKLGRPTEAVDQYRQVVLEFGECGPASLGLGRALAELERPVEAVVEWRRAVKLGVETPEVHRLLAETLVELGRWSEVVEHWKWLLERYPGAAHWRRRLALALMGLGRWTEAAAQWGEYWRVAPGSGRCPVVDFRPQKKTHGEIDHSQELSITGDLTVEFWLYLRDWPKSWTEIISKFVSDEQNEFCFRLKDDQKGQWYYGKGDGCSTSINWVPKKDIRLHEWVHVACVRKVGQYGRIYFNGVLRREDDWSGESEAAGTEAPVRLMGSPQWQRFHDGKLSEVRLWNRALSGDEIREGMCEGLTGEEPGLVGLWHGDESDEGVLVDAVGHHHGRLVMAADAGKERPRVGVCGWELSHNAAGRAYTLAQLYGGFAEVELIGCLFPKYGGQVWEPIRGGEIRCHTIRVEDEGRFVEQALGLVLAHPYEVVHLSKPRMPNIIFGLLYKLVWGARVIVDIDDEELIFVRASEPVDLRELLESGEGLPKWKHLQGKEWTRIAVGLVREFDGVTVSNRALQERYGGVVIRHARDEARFVPSADLKRRSRERFGIAQDKKVVLFFGTPRKHKGLVTTARALGSLGRKDVVFAIIGDFPDGKLKEELQGIPGVDYVFVGNQPFESIPDVVAVGDICVLLQDADFRVSQFQIPAKLSDALGMGLVVLLSETAAVADVIESGAVVPVAEGDLPAVLDRVLSDEAECNKFRVRGRELLAAEFGFGVNGSRLAEVMDEVRSGVGVLSDELNLLLAGFPAVGSVWQHWGEGVLETRRLRPVGQGVSIIVLSWNGAGLLRRLLSSFFATNTYFPVEFIIIDHGSEDNTAEVVRQQAIKGDVRYINRGANFSFSNSCNYGAGLAKYPYLLFLNNDIVFSSDVLPLAVSRLDDATIGAVGVRLDDEPSSLPKGKEPGVHHTGIEFVWNEKRGYFQPEQIRHGSLKDYLANATAEGDFFPAVTGAFLLCRKGDWERVGGFSLDYDYGLEDIDFCLRLGRDLRKKCYCINQVSLQHQEGATRQKGNQQQRRQVRENNHRLFKQGWNNYIRGLVGQPKLKAHQLCMNVLFVLYGSLESNSGYQAQLHAAKLGKVGVDCMFAVPDSSYQSNAGQQASRNPLSPPANVLPFSALLSSQVRFSFADGRCPDVIHAWTPREIVREFVESLLERYPCALVIHLEDNEEYLTEAKVGRPFAELAKLPEAELDRLIPANRYHPIKGRAFLNRAQGLTMIIDSLKEFNTQKVAELVLPAPVDEKLFYPRPMNWELRRSLGISDNSVVLAYTGNVHSGNIGEVRELYRAVEILNQQGCPTILLRTGLNGDKLGVESWGGVLEKYLGWVEREQVPQILAAADVLVQPGVPGVFNDQRVPSKLLEYFAIGRPVVLPKTNLGLRVKHGQQGYVLERSDAQGIAEAVQQIKADTELARRLSDGAVDFYLNQLEQSLIGMKLNDYYCKLTGKVSSLSNGNRQGTTIFVVTPCLNAAPTIDNTIKSVISQSGDFWIRYHVQDGGSTDLTVERLQYWESVLSKENSYVQCRGVEFSWVSEPDQGIYDGVIKGFDSFDIAPRELMTWINADDALMPGALSAVCRIVGEHPEIEWVGGPQYVFETDIQQKVLQRGTPTPTAVIREGLCDGHHWAMLQQEGTFFSKALWFKSKHGLKGFELAGDWNLWREMAHHGVYYQYENPLGAFRKRPGQLSVERIGDYRAEIERVVPLRVRKGRFEQLYREQEWGANLIKSDSKSGKTVVEIESVREVYEKVEDVGDITDKKFVSPTNVIVTANKVNNQHGTGTLIKSIFEDSSNIFAIRSRNDYSGEQDFGQVSTVCECLGMSRYAIFCKVARLLEGIHPERVLCIPYFLEDFYIALAVKKIFGIKLCTYIIDDQNVYTKNISDELVQEVLKSSSLRLIISSKMRDAYESKYNLKFWLLPGVIPMRMRENRMKLGSSLSAKGIDKWIWKSLELGRACDLRFECL
ncbi:tetratricopeptide repeat protein [Limnospira sp. PMC 1298.21]|uniref:tetratricopeptide repeat protein n=1 Tax=Limnospira sp. PMC 1298.21 TaxID=2981081 RepID=UPI0028E174F5|nr:tetratricopeptide repeat protein [Limnospira sp. PMC 1298.21]MDT9286193.1 tetratricopeptide repeat protein [Limnospira sp. PMC 1298.21]